MPHDGDAANGIAACPNGRYLATAYRGGRVVIWDLAAVAGAVPEDPKLTFDTLWKNLHDSDPEVAERASWVFKIDPVKRREFEKKFAQEESREGTEAEIKQKVAALAKELSHPDYRTREKATRSLKSLLPKLSRAQLQKIVRPALNEVRSTPEADLRAKIYLDPTIEARLARAGLQSTEDLFWARAEQIVEYPQR